MSISKIESHVEQAKAHLIFAHGAGADKSSEFMTRFTQLLNDAAYSVTRFNFPYMDRKIAEDKKFPPDRMPKLLDCFEQVLTDYEQDLPLYLIGKSMGGRVAATLSGDSEINSAHLTKIKGVICLGYPFHPIGKPEKLRMTPIETLKKPALILQGDRDKLGDKEMIATLDIPELCQVVFLPDGDHDLKPRVRSGKTHEQNLRQAVREIEVFIGE